ncbi:unnamed protein product [Echinostoma caproni]|uniref:Uncharacterized protein n=1 Tax=Echinostoma caproni TaxID=27848 RepID=A0A183BFA5_9TREM|nr:unnamed protein product [Echinostoma caproni]
MIRRKPPLASAIIFELHELATGQNSRLCTSDPFYVRIVYRNYSWPLDEKSNRPIVLWPVQCDSHLIRIERSNVHSSVCPLAQLESLTRGTYALPDPDECTLPEGWFHGWDRVIASNRLLIQTISILCSQFLLFNLVRRSPVPPALLAGSLESDQSIVDDT